LGIRGSWISRRRKKREEEEEEEEGGRRRRKEEEVSEGAVWVEEPRTRWRGRLGEVEGLFVSRGGGRGGGGGKG